MSPSFSAEAFYDSYPRIEAGFQTALDESLHPRGPQLLYDMVGRLGLPRGTRVVDLGCGEGKHSIALAERFGFRIRGIDPVSGNIRLANEALRKDRTGTLELDQLASFLLGAAESLPLKDACIDLIWCREVIYLIAHLDRVFAECRRVLRPNGRMLIYCTFVTNRLELSDWWYTNLGIFASSAAAGDVEAAFARGGFGIEQSVALGSEFGEYAQETTGEPGRRLLHAARLLRDPERYIARFGRTNYDIMLADCLWHVYRMIGKLSARVYLLRTPD